MEPDAQPHEGDGRGQECRCPRCNALLFRVFWGEGPGVVEIPCVQVAGDRVQDDRVYASCWSRADG